MSKIYEHNVEIGEIIERDMTAEELAQVSLDIEKAQAFQAKLEAEEAKRFTALAKLAALGLTADDLKALGLGGN